MKTHKLLAICMLVGLCAAQPALAAGPNNNISLTMSNCLGQYCQADPGFMGSPATESANFALINQPYSFNVRTADAVSYFYDPQTQYYSATFGTGSSFSGGGFNMTGPNGLIFTGFVTSGKSFSPQPTVWQVEVNYSGVWSNGVHATGTAMVQVMNGGQVSQASLTIQ